MATAILVPVGSAAPQTTGVVVSYARPAVSRRRVCVVLCSALVLPQAELGFQRSEILRGKCAKIRGAELLYQLIVRVKLTTDRAVSVWQCKS